MNELTAALKEELNVDTAFTLPIFGGIEKLLARNLTQQDDARLLDDLLQKAGDSNGK